MARPKAETTTKKNDDSLAIAKAIQVLAKHKESFAAAVHNCENLEADILGDLEMRINNKKKELADLEVQFEQDKKNRTVELDIELREHGYSSAISIIDKHNELAVSKVLYEKQQSELETLREGNKEQLEAAIKLTKDAAAQSHAMTKRTLELEKKAEMANMEAQLNTSKAQIDLLEKTIESLKQDLADQRDLTRSVAESASKSHSQPVLVNK